jgi:hypothetical protein
MNRYIFLVIIALGMTQARAQVNQIPGGTGGSANIPSTTNILTGDGAGDGANSGVAFALGQPQANFPLTISTPTTFYVCPAALSNCAYNGDGGQATIGNPSDSNSIGQAQSKLTPWATITHAASVLKNAVIYGPVTIQLADTSTSCYTDTEVVFNPMTMGGAKYQIFEYGWSQVGGPTAYTDVYPQSYIEIKGNITTPANVSWTAATVPCAGTTSGARTALRFPHTVAVVHGVNFKYWDANNVDNAAVQALDHSSLFIDNITHTGAGGVGAVIALVTYNSFLGMGPNLNGTETGISFCDMFSMCTTHTPAGYLSSTITNNTYAKSIHIANEGAHLTVWGPTTQTFSGTGAYTVYTAQAGGEINTTQAGGGIGAVPSALTVSGANTTLLVAAQFGMIINSCTSTNNNCTGLSSILRHSNVNSNGYIADFVGTQGSSGDTITGDGQIVYTPFGTPTGSAKIAGTVTLNNGTNTLLRCTTAGTLPVGALTIVAGNCGASTDTGIRIN